VNINATLIIQIIVFGILWWFTAKFVWPPITRALDDRSKRIADGLAAADRAKTELAAAELRIQEEIKKARVGASELRTTAERQAAELLDQARAEASKIIAEARKAAEGEAELAVQRVKDQLRDEVALLAVAGAGRILRREVDARGHAQLLADLRTELR
jgi:F-type H+-transporting ATPase subunit b